MAELFNKKKHKSRDCKFVKFRAEKDQPTQKMVPKIARNNRKQQII